MTIHLDRAVTEDFAAVRDLASRYFRFDNLDFTEKTERAIAELLANPSLGSYFLVRWEGAVVGYCALTYGFDAEAGGRLGVVTDLFLVEEARGKGLGPLLVDEILKIAREEGLHQVELYVLDNNDRARRLYAAKGFLPVSGRALMAIKITGQSPPQ